MKKKILLRALIPLTTIGISLGTALPLASCSCNSDGGDQPIVSGYLINGSNWEGCTAGTLTFNRNTTNHTVSYIGYSANYTATDLVIPDTVCDVDGTFYTVTTIGNTAFRNCDTIVGSLTIDNNVTTIGDNAFYGCYRLTSLIVGNNITTIGQTAFYGCTNLIDTSNNIVTNKISQSGDNVYYIDNGTVSYCLGKYSNVTSTGINPSSPLNLLSNTRVIGAFAFYNLMELMTGNLIIPSSVVTIGYIAFYYCYFTGNLIIPNSVTLIDNSAFIACNFTGGLTIPNSVTTIGANAFNRCTYFNGDLTIGNNVTSIGQMAFANCAGFTSIIGNFASAPTIGDYACRDFNNTTGGIVHNNNPLYSSASLLALLQTKGLPNNGSWVTA